ncbi:MAG: hypothetical protein IPI67_34265 [Myxococcales bacterium]|nr:hypothetical protein [Myxococcales bacterium]
MSPRRLFLGLLLLAAPACSSATGGSPDPAEATTRVGDRVKQVKSAYCSITVKGVGARATELDYLPHVLACENFSAGLEALKALAIAARSIAYYSMSSSGSICDGQTCQVYSCKNKPGPLHFQAVKETAQQYLSYDGMVTYAFYVSGDSGVSGPSCIDTTGSMVKYVTFNDGKTGNSVSQSKLGFIGPPGFGQNRGCMSQNGSRCLEENGRDAVGILHFYYGDDIEVLDAPGACSVPSGAADEPSAPPAEEPPPAGTDEPAADPPAADPPPPAAASCQGFCGSSDPAPGSSPACYCDDLCSSLGDCCGDFSSSCN